MSARGILDALKNLKAAHQLALACALLVALAPASLHGQIMYQDLYDISCTDATGCEPADMGSLVQGLDHNLYGTNAWGYGPDNPGSIFMVSPTDPTVYTDLLPFGNSDGDHPFAALSLASDGNFYGSTSTGGSNGNGTLFRTDGSSLTVLHAFDALEGQTCTAPVSGKDGSLYGVTDSGITYRLTLPAGTYSQLSGIATGTYCGSPLLLLPPSPGPLYLASDGYLYGATQTGGKNAQGTIFRMTTPGGAIKVLHEFSWTDGSNPAGPLTQASDGNFYGITSFGGSGGTGVIFRITPSGHLTVLLSLDPPGNATTGSMTLAGLLAASDGYLYGTTAFDGANGLGTIFRITTAGNFTKLFDITSSSGGVPETFPTATLVQHTNGSFYGLATYGGIFGQGNYFSLTRENNLTQIVKIVGPIFVLPGVPVQVLGDNLTQAFSVAFAGENTSFRAGSDTVLTAQVPQDAVDGPITVTYVTGLQIQTQTPIHILPVISNLDPTSGAPGTQVGIVGGGFSRASKVTFGGVKASFTVVNPTLIQAVIPANAKTGKVKVTTPNGTATSRQKFTVT